MSYALYRFIIKPIGMKLLLSIENATVKELSAKTNITRGHINLILIELQNEKIIDRKPKKNRHIGNNTKPSIYIYFRTEKGEQIAKSLRNIKNIIETD